MEESVNQKQGWTHETIRQFWRDNQKKELQDDEQWNTFFQSVADAHKAELAAERQRREQEVYETLPSKDCPTGIKWSEVAKWNGLACEENQKLLLSAQVAIERHNKRQSLNDPRHCYDIKTDMSALHKHDKELLLPYQAAIERLSSASFVEVSENIARMVTTYVENGIKLGTDWRNGLSGIISKRLKHLQVGDDIKIDPSGALHQHDAKLLADIDEARAQRDWLIKECARVGVTVNVQIGAPITEAYRLVNNDAKVREPLVKVLEASKGLVAFGNAQDWKEWEAARDDALVPLCGMKEGNEKQS